jgi:predicted DNA-binding transcriptional regulator AlpA
VRGTTRGCLADPLQRVDLSAGALLDADDVAALLSVKRSTVFELSRRRHDPLPRIKVGRAVRFSLPAVCGRPER